MTENRLMDYDILVHYHVSWDHKAEFWRMPALLHRGDFLYR